VHQTAKTTVGRLNRGPVEWLGDNKMAQDQAQMTLNFEDIKDEARSEVEGSFTLVPTIVFALIVCGLLYLAINGLLRLFAHREVAE